MRSIRNLALAGTLALSALAACSTSTDTADSIAVESTTGADDTSAATTDATDEATGDADGTVTEVAAQATDSTGVGAETLAANSERHDQADDLDWNADDAAEIMLGGDSATASGEGVSVDGSTVTISAAGTYVLSGTLTDGQAVVKSAGEGTVRLVLDGVDIHSSTTAPIAVLAADEVVVVLADGTENRLNDEASYTFADTSTDEPNATLFSAADLTIGGTGSLIVTGNTADGIASKDGLVILTTLGTGIGIALLHNGVLIPNAELGHLEVDGYDAETRAAASIRERDGLSWTKWAARLQRYYTTVENLLWPDLFLVGGGVSRKADKFLPLLHLRTPIIPAALQNQAGIIGAAALAAD